MNYRYKPMILQIGVLMNIDDIKPGYKFNSFTVIERIPNSHKFLVQCTCGNIIELYACRIYASEQRSTCGYCTRKYNRAVNSRDKRRQKIQDIIINHWQRCYNSKADHYKLYGAKGWHFAKEWLKPDGYPDYNIIIPWCLNNGYEIGKVLEKDKLAYELGIKEIGPRTVRFVSPKENSKYTYDKWDKAENKWDVK